MTLIYFRSLRTVPVLRLLHTGKKEMDLITEIINLDLVAKRLDRDPDTVLQFLADQIDVHHHRQSAPKSVAGRRYYLRDYHVPNCLQYYLDRYICQMALCSACKCLKTSITLEDEKGDTRVYCDDCAEALEEELEPEEASDVESRDDSSRID